MNTEQPSVMKHYLKLATILFILSLLPILLINRMDFTGVTAESDGLKGKKGSYFISSIEKKRLSPQLQNEEQEGKVIYLTFDDGPNRNTGDLIKILKAKNAHATFFLLKGNVDKYPEIVQDLVNNGNAIGCHSVSHRIDVFYANPTVAVKEMKLCQGAIYDITRLRTPLIRVPFGSYPHLTPDIKKALEKSGFIYWDWNIDSEDWTNNNPEQIIKNIKTQLKIIEKKGSTPTVLLHDKEVTVEMLPKLLDFLLKNGYKINPITSAEKPVQFNRNLGPAL